MKIPLDQKKFYLYNILPIDHGLDSTDIEYYLEQGGFEEPLTEENIDRAIDYCTNKVKGVSNDDV